MSNDIAYLAIFLLGMAVGGALTSLLHEAEWFKRHIADEAPETELTAALKRGGRIPLSLIPEIYESDVPDPSKLKEFNVTGKPRAVPWHIRKRELEAAARTKRRRLEEFRGA